MLTTMRPLLTVKQLRHARRTARKRGLQADLNWPEWAKTIEDFSGRCAYCRVRDAWTIDHFLPMALGGGTCIDNCLPSCWICNNAKGGKKPAEVLPPMLIEQLECYLRLRLQGQRMQAIACLVREK